MIINLFDFITKSTATNTKIVMHSKYWIIASLVRDGLNHHRLSLFVHSLKLLKESFSFFHTLFLHRLFIVWMLWLFASGSWSTVTERRWLKSWSTVTWLRDTWLTATLCCLTGSRLCTNSVSWLILWVIIPHFFSEILWGRLWGCIATFKDGMMNQIWMIFKTEISILVYFQLMCEQNFAKHL